MALAQLIAYLRVGHAMPLHGFEQGKDQFLGVRGVEFEHERVIDRRLIGRAIQPLTSPGLQLENAVVPVG